MKIKRERNEAEASSGGNGRSGEGEPDQQAGRSSDELEGLLAAEQQARELLDKRQSARRVAEDARFQRRISHLESELDQVKRRAAGVDQELAQQRAKADEALRRQREESSRRLAQAEKEVSQTRLDAEEWLEQVHQKLVDSEHAMAMLRKERDVERKHHESAEREQKNGPAAASDGQTLPRWAQEAVEAAGEQSESPRDKTGGIIGKLFRKSLKAGACSVCRRPRPAMSPEEARVAGWVVKGDMSVCAQCRDSGWQLPSASTPPVRRFSDRNA